jgi:hypothetical protein
MWNARSGLALLATWVWLISFPAPGAGQDADRAVTVLGGVARYDVDDVDTVPFTAVRVDLPLSPALLVEPGLGYLAYRTASDERIRQFLPEVQLQVQLLGERIRPYLGTGIGSSWERGPDRDLTELTVSGAAGVRADAGRRWRVTGEARFRGVGPWSGTVTDWVLGAGWRF